jgi:hypothetical protein
MITSIKKILKKIHHSIPLRIRNIYMPALNRGLYFLRYHQNAVFPPVFLYEGREFKDGHPLSFAYAGNIHEMNHYWDHLILKGGFQKRSLGRHFFGNIRSKINKIAPACGFIFMEQSSLTLPFLNKKSEFSIPLLVQMEIDISHPLDELFDSQRRSDIKRRIYKNHLSYEMSKDPKHFEDFYAHMYTPYIKQRYADAATITTYQSILKTMDNNEMILIKADGKIIAGAIVKFIKGQPPYLQHLGIVDANETYMRYGAIGAIYFFLIEELKKRSYNLLYVGGTRPLLSDGLTKYKLSFKARIRKENKHSCVRLMILNDSQGVKSFLTNSPFLFKNQEKEFCRALFVETTAGFTLQDLTDKLESSHCEGIKETHVYVFGNKGLPEGLDSFNQKISIHVWSHSL